MPSKSELIDVFWDTEKWCESNASLKDAVRKTILGTKFYPQGAKFSLNKRNYLVPMDVKVEKGRSFETAIVYAQKHPNARIGVHNFASATNPGGGVRKGSHAQEESLCRISTLYPALNTEANWKRFYKMHRERHDARYTDACIYTPDIVICKSDIDIPQRLPCDRWCKADVLTCAAPNLRTRPNNQMNPGTDLPVKMSDAELLAIHKSRANHIISVAVEQHIDILILGAFGCGAFKNNPEIVARAYREVLPNFMNSLQTVVFAIYCTERDLRNYTAFHNELSDMGYKEYDQEKCGGDVFGF